MESEQIWMGRADARALKGASPDLLKATYIGAVVFAYATSREDFELAMKATLAGEHLEIVDLEDAGPAHEMLYVYEDKFDCLVETAETGTATWLLYLSDEPPDAVDRDRETIRAAAASGDAVQFHLVGGDYWFVGFVVEVSDDWALIAKIDRNVVAFDGYAAAPFDRIMDAETIDAARTILTRALRLRGESPRNPHVPLDGHRTILMELSKRYPLVSLSDRRDIGNVYVGRVTMVEDDKVTLRGIDGSGEWTGDHEHSYKDVEMISFGSAYEAALASVADGS